MAKKKVLHQVVETVLPGDATSAQVFLLRRWLREMGFTSDIYAQHADETLRDEVVPFSAAALARQDVVIFHHAIGSEVLEHLLAHAVPLVLIYHNITPPEFFAAADPLLARQLIRGREQLGAMKEQVQLALSDSSYSEQELQHAGFRRTEVLPIVLDESHYAWPYDADLQAWFAAKRPLLLFVGRLAPNKRQEDLLKLLYYYRRLRPQAHLVLVGSLHNADYVEWLHAFAARLGLADAVTFAGHVTQQELVTYYRTADLFVSMSEHEGFGKPLIESMYLGLPVLAFAATAVPSTLGGAGILFHGKAYEALAELVDLLVHDERLRQRLLNGQTARVQAFLEPQVRGQWRRYLQWLNLL